MHLLEQVSTHVAGNIALRKNVLSFHSLHQATSQNITVPPGPQCVHRSTSMLGLQFSLVVEVSVEASEVTHRRSFQVQMLCDLKA